MPGPVDNNFILRDSSDGNLTTDENLTFTITGGVPHSAGLAVRVLVPQASGADTLVVTVTCTTTGYKYTLYNTDTIDANTSYAFELILPLLPCKGTAYNVNLNVTDATGDGVNFGAVQVWVERAEHAKLNA